MAAAQPANPAISGQSPPPASSRFREGSHGCRAGDQLRSAFGDAERLDAAASRLAVGTLASYVALDLARRVRVLRTRAGALWLLGAAAALSLGIWSRQIIGIAAEPLAFPLGYDGLGSLGAWAVALVAGLVGLGAVSGRVATPGRVGFGAFALGIGAVGAHALSARRRSACSPGIDWQLLSLVAAVAGAAGGCMMALGAFFRGGDRTRPATPGWQATVGAGARRHPGREPAARARRRRARRADRVDSTPTGSTSTHAGAVRLGRLVRAAAGRPDVLDPRGAPAARRCAAPRPSCSGAPFATA